MNGKTGDIDKLYDMHFGATADIFELSRVLRRHMTYAEKQLWEHLKDNKIDNLKFRRQHPIARYIVDFYCHKKRLVIELDGKIHQVEEVAQNDKEREKDLESLGLRILRFKNEEVLRNSSMVINKIKEVVESMSY